MRLYPALVSVMISGVLGACATELDESGVPTDLESDPQGTSGSTSGGSTSSVSKGGSTSMAFGGATGVGGKASGGASGSGGKASGGSAGTAGTAAEDGGEGGADGPSG